MKPPQTYPRVLPVGEAAFTVEFGDRVDAGLNRRVHALDAYLAGQPVPGVVETVPTYRSLLVTYNPLRTAADAMRASLIAAAHTVLDKGYAEAAAGTVVKSHSGDARVPVIEIPVKYGEESGPDLAAVAAHCGLTPEAVIAQHTAPIYQVAMLGFAPGFAYLLGLPRTLATPRLETPRLRVAAGSVGIAGSQTGIYALSTPGGWRIIGRTAHVLFDPENHAPFALDAGARVRFVAI